MADVWRYRFYQMQNGQQGFTSETHLFDLPVNTATFTSKIGAVGQIAGTVQMSDPTVQAALLGQPSFDLLCERTAVYVELNGDLVWGGILQQANYVASKRQMRIQGQDWWGYFANNRNLSWNASYAGADQLHVAADVINCAMGAPYSASGAGNFQIAGYTPTFTGVVGGNVGIVFGTSTRNALGGSHQSGVLVTQAWQASSAKAVGQIISDLGSAANGFDWTIVVSYDATGAPKKTFNLWYPRTGRTWQEQTLYGSTVVFSVPGSSGQDYQWPTGQDKPCNSLLVSGSAAGGNAVQVEISDPSMLDTGWPLLEDNTSFADVSDPNVLGQVGTGVLNQRKLPIRLPQIQYNAGSESDQPLGSFALGDDARVIIAPDPYFQNGYDSARGNYGEVYWRVVQQQVTVNDDGKSNMLLTFALPPPLAVF